MNMEFSPPTENVDGTATFRKPANRVYRRRSPQSGSSSSDGSPLHERKMSPLRQQNEFGKGSDDQRKREDIKESDRDYGRSHYGRNVDSYRNSDRQSSRGTRSYHRHDHRRDKYAGDDDRDYSRSRSDREPKSNYSDHYRRENEQRLRDHLRDEEKYSRAKSDGLGDKNRDREREKNSDQKHTEKHLPLDSAGSGRRHADDLKYGERDTYITYKDGRVGMDEKNDHLRSSGNYRSDIVPAREESRSHRNDSTLRRDGPGHRTREAGRTDIKPFDGENNLREEKKSDDRERYREHQRRDPKKPSEVDKGRSNREEESTAKKPKLFGLDAPIAEVRQSLSPKHAEEATAQGSAEQACLTDSDIDAAKVAAMKAAEMVNRNLIGTGFMSADQKKKLLWGNKKTIAKEESTNRWDTTMFGDRERQEKFNKLMGVKGEVKVEPNPDTENVEKKRDQLQLDLEKQYTAGLRRRDGRTVGLGL